MTQEHDGQGEANILAGFARFKGGITAYTPEIHETEQTIGASAVNVTLPTVNGELIGEVADSSFWVSMQQLRLAPKEDLLCSRYDPNLDPDFERLKQTLDQMGDQIPALPVLPANQTMVMGETRLPVLLVYDQPEVYYALLALKRSRAKVFVPAVQHAGAILLGALARHGQLRREPSVLETCLAAKRLKEVYGYTLQEIAQMQSRDPEDNTPPSVTQVHYQILVAGLPPTVQDLLHKRHILWSHARKIAEYCAEDEGLCVQLATLVAQGGRMSVEALGFTINRLKDGLARLETDANGVVTSVPTGSQLSSVGDAPSPSAKQVVFYQHMMAAPPAQVRKAAASFHVDLIPAENPQQIAVSSASLDSLREWLRDRHSAVTVRDIEAMLLGCLEAIRFEGVRQGVINKEGALTQVVDQGPSGRVMNSK